MRNSPSKEKTKEYLIPSWIPEEDTSKNEADEKKTEDGILKFFRKRKLHL